MTYRDTNSAHLFMSYKSGKGRSVGCTKDDTNVFFPNSFAGKSSRSFMFGFDL